MFFYKKVFKLTISERIYLQMRPCLHKFFIMDKQSKEKDASFGFIEFNVPVL